MPYVGSLRPDEQRRKPPERERHDDPGAAAIGQSGAALADEWAQLPHLSRDGSWLESPGRRAVQQVAQSDMKHMKKFGRRSAAGIKRTGACSALAILASLAVLQNAAAADKPEAAPASPAGAQEDPAVAALTQPTSIVEIGAGNISNSSYKFGEYNGLEQKGGFVIGNMDMHGGGRYDSDSATRWDFDAHNLGLQASDATFDVRNQGLFKLDFGLSDWRHNLSDTYQSPYQDPGSNVLTLPPDWLKPFVPQASKNLN